MSCSGTLVFITFPKRLAECETWRTVVAFSQPIVLKLLAARGIFRHLFAVLYAYFHMINSK